MNNSYKNYKIAKMNLIEKYSHKINRLRRTSKENSNLDVFISINDFLANEQSLGPKADPGKINYDYGSLGNINNYLKILIDELNYKSKNFFL